MYSFKLIFFVLMVRVPTPLSDSAFAFACTLLGGVISPLCLEHISSADLDLDLRWAPIILLLPITPDLSNCLLLRHPRTAFEGIELGNLSSIMVSGQWMDEEKQKQMRMGM
jgi:hypothetical protein